MNSNLTSKTSANGEFWSCLGAAAVILAFTTGIGGCSLLMNVGDAIKQHYENEGFHVPEVVTK